jgi:hypothetical protein
LLQEIPLPEWDECLDVHGLTDAYLRSSYLVASSALDGGEAKLLMYESKGGGVAFPLLVRSIGQEGGVRDVTTPYGYGGPVGFGVAPPWKAFHAAYEGWCRDNRIVTTFARFHPLYENHRHASSSMQVELLAGTVGWRVDSGRDLLAQLHKHHRRSVFQSVRRGLRVAEPKVNEEGLARFRVLYAATMDRVGATDYYRFPDAYWHALRTGLGPRLSLAEISDEGGEILSAALLLRTPPWLHYHLGASTEEGRRVGATVALFVGVAQSAQEEGFRVFHLGGGVGGSADSLFSFKLRFDPSGLRQAAIGKQIHDMDEYRQLTGISDTAGYFPAYRRRD